MNDTVKTCCDSRRNDARSCHGLGLGNGHGSCGSADW